MHGYACQNVLHNCDLWLIQDRNDHDFFLEVDSDICVSISDDCFCICHFKLLEIGLVPIWE